MTYCVSPSAPTAPLAPFAASLPAYREGARLAVVGDPQRTAPVLEFWREQNDAERARMVEAIARARPDLLVITGDCVFDGGSESEWSAFDRLMAPLRVAAIPVVGAFGNHEYWRGRASADTHFFRRFQLNERRHWLAVSFGPLRVIVLDSNRTNLTDDEWSTQLRWYDEVLRAFDEDPTVRGVFVTFHHPPFTNRAVTGDNPTVQVCLVPPFARARKTLAMLNGHVHSYERFTRGGKAYVVSGGGGGPRVRLRSGVARRHPDDHCPRGCPRDFHFGVYTIADHGVNAAVHGLARGATTWTILDTFDFAWPT